MSENSRTGKWGTGSIEIISNQLQHELPGLKWFSFTNMRYMRLFFEAWSPFFEDNKTTNHHLSSDDLENFMSVGFTHHREILGKTSVLKERLF